MTTEASPTAGGAPRRVAYATNIYVGAVAAAGICLTAAAIRLDGIEVNATFGVLLLLALLSWLLGSVESDGGRTQVSLNGIVMLAAMALVGPAGAGIVGTLVGPFHNGRAPMRARIFNSGMFATMGVVGGAAYIVAGGRPGGPWPVGTWEIALQIGIPVLVADVVQFAVNLVLLALVVRLAAGVSMRTQMGQIISSSGSAQIGYGIIAFIMVVLWGPARLGSASVFLILPPLLAAQWAYRQYAEERKGHDRALHVLVAAVEAKAPHLTGHSTRVAELSASMAEHLGLRAQTVADARVAGMLHDLGPHQPAHRPRPQHRGDRWRRDQQLPGAWGGPAAWVELPVGCPRRHRPPPRRRGAAGDGRGAGGRGAHRRAGRRVRPAHRGGYSRRCPGQQGRSPGQACGATPSGSEEMVRALEHALTLRVEVSPS